jgi:glycosyltransferase involved in cell wall biosynthesis
MRTIARALAQAGLEVHVATTDDNGVGHLNVPLGQPVRQDGVTIWYFRRQTRFYAVSWPLTRWLARHISNYDLVHIHALFSYASLPAAFFAARHRVPYIVRPLGTLNRWGMQQRRPLLKRLSFRLIESRILSGASIVHYTSEEERLEAEELGVVASSAVIPLGIDLSAFEHLPAPGTFQRCYPQLAGRTLLLFLSRLDPTKGLDLLLPAFAQVRREHSDVALVLAGHGAPDYEAWLQARVRELGLGADVLFTGFLEGEQKLAALGDCDLFVLPSYSENFGVAVVEAMACGRPVVISNQVAIHREIADAEAGLVVPCEVEALAGALVRLAEDAALRHRLGRNGRRLAEERFSMTTMAMALQEAYVAAMAQSRDSTEGIN